MAKHKESIKESVLRQYRKDSISLQSIHCSLLYSLVTVCINKITRRVLIVPGSLAAFQPMLTEAKYTCCEGHCAGLKRQQGKMAKVQRI